MKKLVIAFALLAAPLLSTPSAFASEGGPKPAVESIRSVSETKLPDTARKIGDGCINGTFFQIYSYFGYVYSVPSGVSCDLEYVHFGWF